MQKKLEKAGRLTRISLYTFLGLIFTITSCGDKLARGKGNNNGVKPQSKYEKFSDTSLIFLGTQNSETIAFPKLEFAFLESLVGKLRNAKIESCLARVDRYQQLFSQDSVLDVYKINLCEQNLLCKILFGTDSNKRVFFLNSNPLLKKSITSFNSLIPDSLNLQIAYEYSHYFKIKAKKNFLLIVSKSEQWTGKMSNYNFFQLIDLTSLTVFEFVNS